MISLNLHNFNVCTNLFYQFLYLRQRYLPAWIQKQCNTKYFKKSKDLTRALPAGGNFHLLRHQLSFCLQMMMTIIIHMLLWSQQPDCFSFEKKRQANNENHLINYKSQYHRFQVSCHVCPKLCSNFNLYIKLRNSLGQFFQTNT